MGNIVYYVATSIDGYISGPNEDISRFVESDGIRQYLKDLQDFDTVIMGRRTYEFGYKFGLVPGQLPYPHMKHYVFSSTLKIDNLDKKLIVTDLDINTIEKLKLESDSDIYLCGGGEFAGWLLDNEKIDILKIKLNPMILGNGIKLFGSSTKPYNLELIEAEKYSLGLQIITYRIKYE